jgi:hypothetical protein
MSTSTYENNLRIYSAQKKDFERRSTTTAWLRLIIFLSLCLFVYFAREQTFLLFSGILILVVLFGWLVKQNKYFDDQAKLYDTLCEINHKEFLALNGVFSSFASGKEFQDPSHHYSHDLDLFGNRSLFQFLNRSETDYGKSFLATHLKTDHTEKSKINQFMEFTQELTPMLEWRQKLQAIGKLSFEGKKKKSFQNASGEKIALPGYFSLLLVAIPIFSWALVMLYNLDVITLQLFITLLVIPFGLYSGVVMKKATLLHHFYGSLEKIIKQQGEIISHLEKAPLNSSLAKEEIKSLFGNERNLSGDLDLFIKYFDNLEQRSSFLISILLNLFFSWDILWLKKLENWHQNHGHKINQWAAFIGKIEAFSSLANFAYNHPDYSYPIAESKTVITAKNLGHPLLLKNRVTNDYALSSIPQIHLVTGANMAGKSTFLRAVGVNLVLARCGAPVCASHFEFTPMKLYSGMRTDDSLQDGASYFFSELRRLGSILDELKKGQPVFILLDEILKGTNSKDKEEGSKKYIESLLSYPVTGLLATHDLALCKMEADYPCKIINKSFEVEFEADDLVFDYELKEGACKTMNASFLMKKLGLISED